MADFEEMRNAMNRATQDDIVILMLREYEYMNAGRGGDYEMLLQGAQEIERLRAEIKTLKNKQ